MVAHGDAVDARIEKFAVDSGRDARSASDILGIDDNEVEFLTNLQPGHGTDDDLASGTLESRPLAVGDRQWVFSNLEESR